MQRSVVELELVEGVAQRLVLVGLHWIEAGEDLRLDLLETRQRAGGGSRGEGYRITHARRVDFLDAGDDEADVAGGKLVATDGLRREHAHLLAVIGGAGGHELDLVLGPERAVHHAHQHDDPDVVVEPRIDDERRQGRVRVSLGRRHLLDHGLQDVVDADAVLGARAHRVGGVDADDVLDLVDDALRVRRAQVDLVQHRQHFDALLDGGVAVGHRLRLDTLRGIDDQERAFAGGKRARHFVGEVDVAGRVDQVERVGLAIACGVCQRGRLRLDGDAALALEIHRIEHLLAHLAVRQSAAALDEAVGQRGLAVVDVGDDREVADIAHAVVWK
jgi:hypothetical protein